MKRRPGETKAQLREKLAAVLRDLMVDVDGKLERAIPYDDAKKMTADQVISLFNFDHGIHHAIGGQDVHWNYTARMIKQHREKTAKVDRPQIEKTKRIVKATREYEAARNRMGDDLPEPTREPKPKVKMRSRGFGKAPPGSRFDWGKGRYVKE